MTTAELLTMARVAESRGERDVALAWKKVANESTIREDTIQRQADFEARVANQYVPPPGSQIVAPTAGTPWGDDDEYRSIQAQIAQATSTEGWGDDAETRTKVAALNSSLKVRAEAARREAMAAGHWTTQDENMAVARDMLNEKARVVAEQVRSQ